MDKRAVLFVILSIVIIVGWQMLFAPTAPETPPRVEPTVTQEEPVSEDAAAPPPSGGPEPSAVTETVAREALSEMRQKGYPDAWLVY